MITYGIFTGIVVDDSVSLNTYNFERNVRLNSSIPFLLSQVQRSQVLKAQLK